MLTCGFVRLPDAGEGNANSEVKGCFDADCTASLGTPRRLLTKLLRRYLHD